MRPASREVGSMSVRSWSGLQPRADNQQQSGYWADEKVLTAASLALRKASGMAAVTASGGSTTSRKAAARTASCTLEALCAAPPRRVVRREDNASETLDLTANTGLEVHAEASLRPSSEDAGWMGRAGTLGVELPGSSSLDARGESCSIRNSDMERAVPMNDVAMASRANALMAASCMGPPVAVRTARGSLKAEEEWERERASASHERNMARGTAEPRRMAVRMRGRSESR